MFTLILKHKGREQSRFKIALIEMEYLLVYTENGTLTLIPSDKKKEQRICARLKLDASHHLSLIPEESIKLNDRIPLTVYETYSLLDGDRLLLKEKEYEAEVLQGADLGSGSIMGVGASGDTSNSRGIPPSGFGGSIPPSSSGLGSKNFLDGNIFNTNFGTPSKVGSGKMGSGENLFNKLSPSLLPILDSSVLQGSTGVPSSNKLTSSPEEKLTRQNTVRYFRQMYPFHTYPVRVLISDGKVQEVQIKGMVQATGNTPFSLNATQPIVTIRPIFPGALIVPDYLDIDVTQPSTQAEFWITPQTEGHIKEARVEIYYQGKCLDRVPTPYTVSKHTLAKASLFCSFLFPVLGPIFNQYQFTLEQQFAQGFPLLKPIFFAFQNTPELAGFLGFSALAGLLFWWKRPKEANPIIQLLALDPLILTSPPEKKQPSFAVQKNPSDEKKVGNGDKTEVDRLYDQARKLFDEAKNEEALLLYEKALPLYRNLRLCDEYGLMLCDMGRTLLALNEYERALNIYAEELGVWVRLGLETDRGRCLSNIGITHRLRKDYHKAEIFLREAVEIRKHSHDIQGHRRSLKELGAVYELQAKWDQARDLYLDLANTYKTEGNQEEYAHILNLLGIVHYKEASDDRAIRYYTESLHINESLGLELPKADNLYNLGLVYKQKRNKETALKYFKEAHEIYVAQGDQDWARSAENSIRDLEKL
ncbi:MAG: tetratricopeptide repeat protein [Planctomycetota bacterium]